MFKTLRSKTTKYSWIFLQLFITLNDPFKGNKLNTIHNPYFNNKNKNINFYK